MVSARVLVLVVQLNALTHVRTCRFSGWARGAQKAKRTTHGVTEALLSWTGETRNSAQQFRRAPHCTPVRGLHSHGSCHRVTMANVCACHGALLFRWVDAPHTLRRGPGCTMRGTNVQVSGERVPCGTTSRGCAAQYGSPVRSGNLLRATAAYHSALQRIHPELNDRVWCVFVVQRDWLGG